MRKYLGLFIIVLMIPLTSGDKVYAMPAIPAEDFSYVPEGRVFNTDALYIGNDLTGASTTPYAACLMFK